MIPNGLRIETTTYERPIYGSSRLGIMIKAVKSPKSTVCSLPSFYLFLTDYYPFGYPISFRTHSTGYRYGFNGQEGDNEIYGDKLNYAFQYRMYDTRIGRFWSVDPLKSKFPMLTTYQFASNNPIGMIEFEGLEGVFATSDFIKQSWGVGTGVVKQEDIDTELKIKQNMMIAYTQGTIDGLTYFATSRPDFPLAFGFTFKNGFSLELSYYYNITWENSFRYFGGALDAIGFGLAATRTISAIKSLYKTSTSLNSISFADNFYKLKGYSNEALRSSHLGGIDFNFKVFTKNYPKGTRLTIWAKVDKNGIPILNGSYYSLPGSDPTKLGIPLKNRVKVSIELLEDTEFLQSTTKDIIDWTGSGKILNGGEIQLFSPNAKYKIIME